MSTIELDLTEKERCQKQVTLILGAIGVAYGDIGTSPLYTLRECFHGLHPVALTTLNILGVLSLIFWALLFVVSIKYMLFILRADNRGEGGILALMVLAIRGRNRNKGWGRILVILGIFGAALFYGDGMITPAISVLSAVEGLQIALPALSSYIVPLAVVVLVGLFAIQARGTTAVGKLFAPIMGFWFGVLALLGMINIFQTPEILYALNPYFAFQFITVHPKLAFLTLGAVVLALTGAEALYADMGHFGRQPIRRAWFFFVLPALVLNYFGQGALLLHTPSAVHNPFYLLAPSWLQLPLVILATMAAVIASQAVISGAFSLTRQAVQLGYCPRVHVAHTSEDEKGQIYIPQVNWGLLIAVVLLVVTFRSSGNLAAAYGIAVTTTMVITTLLAFVVMRHPHPVIQFGIWLMLTVFLSIDLAFFSSNLVKVLQGGWFPLLIAIISLMLMLTWKRGRELVCQNLHEGEFPLEEFVASLESSLPQRVEGVAVFLTGSADRVPHALLHNLKHNKILHSTVVFLTIRTLDIPYVSPSERIKMSRLSDTFYQTIASYGFKEEPSVPEILKLCSMQSDLDFDMMMTSFFLSRETIVSAKKSKMGAFRRQLFSIMIRNSVRTTAYFKLPPNRVVEMGTQVEL
jgi:KUP system potassium uptake protein